ncbi:MAG: hypothetical protein PHD43_14580 [Methylococcales bacterium]|nr:hypothetical protein [Methylococcales bacterium]
MSTDKYMFFWSGHDRDPYKKIVYRSHAPALIVIHKYLKARHSGRDCRNPDYMDVFKITIHGTGYPLPGGYDVLWELVYNDERSGMGTIKTVK